MFEQQVSIVECSAFETEKLEELIRGVDVVMSFVGMVKRGVNVVEPAVQNTLAAIKNLSPEQRPAKFLSMSTLGVNDGVALARKAWGYITTCLTGVVPGLKDSFRDLAAGEELIMESRRSDVDMPKLTIVRCSILADGKDYALDLANGKSAYTIVKMDEDLAISALGELHILNNLNQRKHKMTDNRSLLGDSLRRKRELLMTGEQALTSGMTMYATSTSWLDDSWTRRGFHGDPNAPKFVGSGANELSKWLNAESINRHKEEMNREHPTLRMVMKVDDQIDMKQMTKSQMANVGDPTAGDKYARIDPTAKLRHMQSYRAAQMLKD